MYLIKKSYHYYDGTLNVPTDRYLKDETDRILTFDTPEEAKAYLTEHEEELGITGVYVTDHGEYARPDYNVVEFSSEPDCFDVPFIVGEEYGWGTHIAEDYVPDDIREKLLSINVEWVESDTETSTYTAEARQQDVTCDDGPDLIYTIAYFPTNAALDYYEREYGDLGALDWDFPKFFVREE